MYCGLDFVLLGKYIYVCIGVSEVINRVIGDGAMGYFGKSISE